MNFQQMFIVNFYFQSNFEFYSEVSIFFIKIINKIPSKNGYLKNI